jgi:hypothetical protein
VYFGTENGAVFDFVLSIEDDLVESVEFVGLDVGEETQSAEIYAEDWDLTVADAIGSREQSAIATEANGNVGRGDIAESAKSRDVEQA